MRSSMLGSSSSRMRSTTSSICFRPSACALLTTLTILGDSKGRLCAESACIITCDTTMKSLVRWRMSEESRSHSVFRVSSTFTRCCGRRDWKKTCFASCCRDADLLSCPHIEL